VTANSLPESQERIAKPMAVALSISPLFLSNRRYANDGTVGHGNDFVFHIDDRVCPRIVVQIEKDATRSICRISTRDLHEQFGDFLPLSFGSSFDDDYFDFFVSLSPGLLDYRRDHESHLSASSHIVSLLASDLNQRCPKTLRAIF
jgi:hypothetical protein